MNEYGVCVLDNFIGEEKGLKVLQETKSLYTAGYFKVTILNFCRDHNYKLSGLSHFRMVN